MTVFPDGSKERLHGHNYTVALSLELSDTSFAKIIPFAVIRAGPRRAVLSLEGARAPR